ncbi:uncharacterized protein isoform X2 [Choristoneura fumiferana]|uniref:uncharacterized protein isoform X2 n=1 Tax=Choristoneura fumiferana TaxID=7141 RepID=UPI003D15E300
MIHICGSEMGRRSSTYCFQIFSYILVSIVFTNGQYDSLNLGKKLKTHEVEYGTLLSSIETGPREQLSSKKILKDSGVVIAFAQSDKDSSEAQEAPVTEATDPLFTTKCTTNRAIVVNESDFTTDDGSDVTEDPIEPTEDPVEPTTEPTEDPVEPTTKPTEDLEEPTDDSNDVTNNEVDPTATDETEPPTTKAYDGPKKTHVPDHYLDDV